MHKSRKGVQTACKQNKWITVFVTNIKLRILQIIWETKKIQNKLHMTIIFNGCIFINCIIKLNIM